MAEQAPNEVWQEINQGLSQEEQEWLEQALQAFQQADTQQQKS